MILFSVQIMEFLELSSELNSLTYCPGPSPSMADAGIKPDVHKLIHKLVLHIHENEPDIEKSILVFLPTYYSLEQQWCLLKPLSSSFKVHILHRSVDTEQALMAMKIWKSHRKVCQGQFSALCLCACHCQGRGSKGWMDVDLISKHIDIICFLMSLHYPLIMQFLFEENIGASLILMLLLYRARSFFFKLEGGFSSQRRPVNAS
jgi:hypothetical protein